MLSRIDAYLISLQHKKHYKPFKGIATSRWGFILATVLVLRQTITEIIEKQESGHYILAGVFVGIGLLLSFYGVRRIIWNKPFDKVEFRLKLAEVLIVLYTGFEHWQQFYFGEHNRSTRILVLPLVIIVLAAGYLMQARMIWLKIRGRIKH